jgi:MFS transporter, DHA3 family, macrolide efflux protein
MFLSVVALALIVGALAGGGIPRLADLKLRWIALLGLALALRVLAVLGARTQLAEIVPLPALFLVAYLLIFAWLWGNWRVPGLQIAAVGIGLNSLAVILNGGLMPIWGTAFSAAGFTPEALVGDPFHFLLASGTVADFVASGGVFGDVVPIPIPLIRDVVSIGDILLAVGIFWTIVYSMTRPEAPIRGGVLLGPRPGGDPFTSGVPYPGGSPTPALAVAVPVSSPATAAAAEAVVVPRPQSPYLALARNRNFSLLWVAGLVSFLGDRIHQIAVATLVLQLGSALDLGIVFAATAIPNVFLGPLAGALVDRWDRRRTMIACDLVRAGLVLLVVPAAGVSIGLVYLITFVIATVGLLFRPAKNVVVPAIVEKEQLVAANSASSMNETLADLVGYPIAGAIVAVLINLLGAAFVLDAGTYLVSAFLIWGMSFRATELEAGPFSLRVIWRNMADGWRFLTRQTELFANTAISTIALLAFGAEIVCSLVYARDVLDQRLLPYPQNYAWMQSALGLGSVLAGLALGAWAGRAPKGLLTISGFVTLGFAMVAAGFVTQPFVAIALFFAIGAANMLYLVPTITLFQERTPERLLGRVVSTRQALTFGAMALSMGLAGWAADGLGAARVLMLGGMLIAGAGLVGLALPAMRDAR